ncbi:MAG TPA: DUF5317 family protein [Sporichthyaceae bacterium]|jgi:hypothetical protein|nr:DUF5317 family protein [Sporichthyaceae bacterium]
MGLTMFVVLIAALGGWLSSGLGGRIRGHRLASAGLALACVSVLFCEPLVASAVPRAYPTAVVLAALLLLQFSRRNLHVPGVPLVAVGLLLNAIVVVANGSMPVEQMAATRAGGGPVLSAADRRHVLAGVDTRLRVLDDRVAVPLPGHREVDSLGDMAIAAGLGLCACTAVRRRRGVFELAAPGLLQRA